MGTAAANRPKGNRHTQRSAQPRQQEEGSKVPAETHHHASGGRPHALKLPRVERLVRHGRHPLHAAWVATSAKQRCQVDLLPRLHLVLLLGRRRAAVGLRRQQLRQQGVLLLPLELLLLGGHARGLHARLGRQAHSRRAVLHAARWRPAVLQLHGRLHAGGRRRLHAWQHVAGGHVAGGQVARGRVGRAGRRAHVPGVLHGVHARRQLPWAKALQAMRGPSLEGGAGVLVPHGRHAPRRQVLRHAAMLLMLLLRAATRLLLLLLLPRWRLPGVT